MHAVSAGIRHPGRDVDLPDVTVDITNVDGEFSIHHILCFRYVAWCLESLGIRTQPIYMCCAAQQVALVSTSHEAGFSVVMQQDVSGTESEGRHLLCVNIPISWHDARDS